MKTNSLKINLDRVINDTVRLSEIQDAAGDTRQIAALYQQLLEEAGCQDVRKYELIPSNPTLIARYSSANPSKGKTIIFNGHMDVVTLDHEAPFVEDGKIYGRGTCDMKGSLACMLEVIRLISSSKLDFDGEIIVIANSMHESPNGRGEDLSALAKSGKVKADAAVVMEGATYDCTIAQLGSATFTITIEREGEPSHQLFTPKGTIHPISVLAEVIKRIEQANNRLLCTPVEGVGNPSYFIGSVHSGEFYNQMPNKAYIEGVRRYGPEESYQEVYKELTDVLQQVSHKTGADISLDMKKVRDGYRIEPDQEIVTALRRSVKKIRNIDIPLMGKQLVTDASIFVIEMDIPTVCYGPDQTRAHNKVEYVSIDELEKTIHIYLQLLKEYIGLKL